MAFLMLYGNGWTQRWRIAPGTEEQVRSQILDVGTDGTGQLTVVDPGSDDDAVLVVAWALVAAAIVIDGAAVEGSGSASGQYA
jgi:hypothetical protein